MISIRTRPSFSASRERAGMLERLERARPVLRGDRRVRDRDRSPDLDAPAPQRALRQVVARKQLVDLLAERAACLRPVPAGVHADLVGEARDAEPRQPPRDPGGVQRFEQIERAVLAALGGRDAGLRPVREQQGFRDAGPLQDVEPVREQRRRLLRAVALPKRRREHGGEHAGERRAPPQARLGISNHRTRATPPPGGPGLPTDS